MTHNSSTHLEELILFQRSVCHNDPVIELPIRSLSLRSSAIVGEPHKRATLLVESENLIGAQRGRLRNRLIRQLVGQNCKVKVKRAYKTMHTNKITTV